MSQSRLKSVFIRMGGEEKLRKILQDFYHKMSQDVLIGFFFSQKNIQEIANKQADFLLFAAGLKTVYSGKNPTQAHLNLPPILQGHFDRRLILLKETLESHHINPKDIKTWINFENAFRDVIIHS